MDYHYFDTDSGDKPEESGAGNYDFYEVDRSRTIPPLEDLEPEVVQVKPAGHGSGFGKKLGVTIVLALVFGLVAGIVFQGVNLAAKKGLGTRSKSDTTVSSVEPVTSSTGSTQQTGDSSSEGYTVAGIAQNAMPSVVAITAVSVQEVQSFWGGTQQYEGVGSGSGIIIGQNDNELLIATNNHVVADAKDLSVSFYGDEVDATVLNEGGTIYGSSAEDLAKEYAKNSVAAQVKGTDPGNDLAVISVKKDAIPEETMAKIKVASMGDSSSLAVGEQVVAIGNALGYGQSVTSGWVSALDRKIDTSDDTSGLIQTDAAINPGNSGGALLNMRGEVVGINSSKFSDEQVEGMGFAIPISKAQPILDEMMSRETREKLSDKDSGYLGINCREVSSEVAQMYHIPTGVFVDEPIEGGAAEKAGVLSGDIIVQFEKTKITSYADLTEQLTYYAPGETVEIVVARAEGGEYKEHTLSITLDEKPASAN